MSVLCFVIYKAINKLQQTELSHDLPSPCICSVSGRHRLIIQTDVSGGGGGEAEAKCYHGRLMGPGGDSDRISQMYSRKGI